MANPAGESKDEALKLDFDRRVMLQFRGSVVTPSRPGEFHPKPLTEPDLILSHHPARATAGRLPPSAEIEGSSPCQLA
jgi:hypothetical protein